MACDKLDCEYRNKEKVWRCNSDIHYVCPHYFKKDQDSYAAKMDQAINTLEDDLDREETGGLGLPDER